MFFAMLFLLVYFLGFLSGYKIGREENGKS